VGGGDLFEEPGSGGPFEKGELDADLLIGLRVPAYVAFSGYFMMLGFEGFWGNLAAEEHFAKTQDTGEVCAKAASADAKLLFRRDVIGVFGLNDDRLPGTILQRREPKNRSFRQRSLYHCDEIFAGDRFGEKCLGAESVHLLLVDLAESANEDDAGKRGIHCTHAAEQSDAVHDGQANVGHEQVNGGRPEDGERGLSVLSGTNDAAARRCEPKGEDFEEDRFVVYQQNGCFSEG
jgi:hypothetical protein